MKTAPPPARPSYQWVLPVIFLEFLSIAVARCLLPSMLDAFFGARVYVVAGVVEAVKGLLSFVACPLFGKVSDVLGRRPCLFLTVLGTTAPVWLLAFTRDLWMYVVLQGL